MKIAITTVQAPFITGGAEFHAQNLRKVLIENGHECDIVTMPFYDNPIEVIKDYIIAARLMNINDSWGGHIDLCIGLKFPAYFMPHNNKVIWVLHQHRAAYDLFDTIHSNIKNDVKGNRIKKIISNADNKYLKEAKKIYANSRNVSNRMKKFNNINSTPLYHPCPDMDKFYCNDYDDNYILMPSRINQSKRQLLALEAMKYTKTNIKLYIVGRPDNQVVEKEVIDTIKKFKLQNKVRYIGPVTQEEKFKLYAEAKAVLFIPVDEDYGYITLEAMSSSKAVITTTDSGGPLEFIENEKNGLVVPPIATNIADAIDNFAKSKNICKQYGEDAKQILKEMNISWDNVVKELTKKR